MRSYMKEHWFARMHLTYMNLHVYACTTTGICTAGETQSAWSVWHHMKDVANVIPSPDLYVAMLTCASSSGELWDLVAAGERAILLLYQSVVSVPMRANVYC
jgi:hypothetical protein